MPNDVAVDDIVEAMKRILKVERADVHASHEDDDQPLRAAGRDDDPAWPALLRPLAGPEMRQAHHAMGLEINMKNLIGCWDNASTYIVKDTMEAERQLPTLRYALRRALLPRCGGLERRRLLSMGSRLLRRVPPSLRLDLPSGRQRSHSAEPDEGRRSLPLPVDHAGEFREA